jgi:hypothetical protein
MHIARNHTGHRVGECHQRARLTDAHVRAMREDRAAGLSYGRLALKYGCGISTARDIVNYWTRASA